ncbi:succinoglycan biosynthesis protein ExoO [Pararhizobium capsulatum DSM 1112]|uniref:Succinoglycan biosynthesis protein ExoO n=1 Tax=Pararhizobium capsulatum DSM 1112 TaxID=1121113 RepID=A0ABU0BW73_9HYPH|nr:glycosyltransferase family 2 protein [Pararhizobium capsulatum]MDQ0322512.1 succinoglycan biosynthesis protein ExoO [Pararhizobium capsulatum DSM 1112]
MMVAEPDVTFIVAAYNCAPTISRAIESALAQRGLTVEVVVIDDCSSDDTREVVGAIADERVRLVSLSQNRGPGGARNAGFDVARGRWLAILDSDDTIEPERLSLMVARAEEAGADIAVDNLEVISGDGAKQRMFSGEDLRRHPMLTLPAFIDSNRLFRATHNFGYMKPIFLRSFIEAQELRFDDHLRIGEDYILLASALACGGVCAIEPSAGYVYHIREGSISRVLRLEHVDAMIAGDQRFLGRFALQTDARSAQRRRERSLREARSFLTMVEHLKAHAFGSALCTAVRNPRAVRHLHMPVTARLRRIVSRFAGNTSNQRSSIPGKAHNPSKG